jgi:tight adherence protein B
MIYFTNPSYIMLLFTDPIGHAMLIFAGIMMVLGIITMKNMVQIKV